MLFMFRSSFVVNKNVVQINLTKFIDKFEQHVVYILLSTNRIISQFEKHNMIFVNVYERYKRNEIFVVLNYSKFIECNNNIELEYIFAINNSCQNFIY